MCGRGATAEYLLAEDARTLRENFEYEPAEDYQKLQPNWNLVPTQPIRVLLEGDGKITVTQHRWGTNKDRLTFNVKSEELDEKAWHGGRRCIAVMDGFYEWDNGQRAAPHYIHPKHGPLSMAALWYPDGIVIITVPAPEGFALRDRFPAASSIDDLKAWCQGGKLPTVQTTDYAWHPVSTRVNNSTISGMDLIKSVKTTAKL